MVRAPSTKLVEGGVKAGKLRYSGSPEKKRNVFGEILNIGRFCTFRRNVLGYVKGEIPFFEITSRLTVRAPPTNLVEGGVNVGKLRYSGGPAKKKICVR